MLAIVPVAVVANFARVIILVLTTYYAGEAVAQGFVHNFAGLTMFIISVLGIFAVDAAASPLRRRLGAAAGNGDGAMNGTSMDGETPTSSPTALNRRGMLIGGAMLAAVGVAWAREPTLSEPLLGKAKLDDVVPKRLGPWEFQTASGLVLPPPDQMRDEIYSDLLTRVYVAPDGAGVMLLIAYSGSQDGVIQVHRPEVCYPASGYTLTRTEERSLNVGPREIPSRFMVAEGGGRLEQLIYWTRLGPSFPTTWLQQRVDVIQENLKGLIPDGVLVRISTNAPDSESGVAILERFAGDFIAALPALGRRVMIG